MLKIASASSFYNKTFSIWTYQKVINFQAEMPGKLKLSDSSWHLHFDESFLCVWSHECWICCFTLHQSSKHQCNGMNFRSQIKVVSSISSDRVHGPHETRSTRDIKLITSRVDKIGWIVFLVAPFSFFLLQSCILDVFTCYLNRLWLDKVVHKWCWKGLVNVLFVLFGAEQNTKLTLQF